MLPSLRNTTFTSRLGRPTGQQCKCYRPCKLYFERVVFSWETIAPRPLGTFFSSLFITTPATMLSLTVVHDITYFILIALHERELLQRRMQIRLTTILFCSVWNVILLFYLNTIREDNKREDDTPRWFFWVRPTVFCKTFEMVFYFNKLFRTEALRKRVLVVTNFNKKQYRRKLRRTLWFRAKSGVKNVNRYNNKKKKMYHAWNLIKPTNLSKTSNIYGEWKRQKKGSQISWLYSL